jgi:hypothetical protein
MRLNYEQSTAKRTRTPRRWYLGDPDCAGSGGDTGNDCDEFPFFSTEQGGREGILRTGRKPDLEPIPSEPNRVQGREALAAFYGLCAMRTGVPQPGQNSLGGDPYLVVPMPALPTMLLCNGKSATNQP